MVRKSPPVTAHPETFEFYCRSCNVAKPKERFRPYPNGGFEPTCRDCLNDRQREKRRIYMVRYRAEHADYVAAANRRRDPEACREQARAWRAVNPERARESQAAYRERNRERLRDYAREYRELQRQSASSVSGNLRNLDDHIC